MVKEVGQVISLSNDIDSTVASRVKQVAVVISCQAVERCVSHPRTMEEILFGTLWNMIGLLLTTDDVVMLRTVAGRWNVGNRYGALRVDTFFMMLKMEQFEKHGTVIRMADACTPRNGSETRSWTVSAGAGFTLLRRRRHQTNKAWWIWPPSETQ